MSDPTMPGGMDRPHLRELLARIDDRMQREQQRLSVAGRAWQNWTTRLAMLLADLPTEHTLVGAMILDEVGDDVAVRALVDMSSQRRSIQHLLGVALTSADAVTASATRELLSSLNKQEAARALVAGWLELATADEAVEQR